jgi:hypothetical protein
VCSSDLYNPINRDENGYYTSNEWTCPSEIGKLYNGKEFKFHEYLLAENAYITTVRIPMKSNGVSLLQTIGIEAEHKILNDFPDISSNTARKYINSIKEGDFVNCSNIDFLIKLILRNMFWCKLKCQDMFVHFGCDYYMYIGSKVNLSFESTLISELGLFVEEMPSPHM